MCYSILGDRIMAQTKAFIPEKFFPSFEALESDIQQRLIESGLSVDDCRTPIAILYLAWAGFDKASISKLQKDHLPPIGNVIYDPDFNHTRDIPPSAMVFLRKYSDAPIFMSHRGISLYLVRNRSSMQLTDGAIINSVAHFNRLLNDNKPNYSFVSIRDSGSFCRAFQMQQSGVEFPVYRRHKRLTQLGVQKYEMIFGREFSSVEAVTRHINLYEIFVEYFYNIKL